MNEKEPKDPVPMKTLPVLVSYQHKNTEKIARVFGDVPDARIKTPQEVHSKDFQEYDLVALAEEEIPGNAANPCLALPTDYPLSGTGEHSFSRPAGSRSLLLAKQD